MNSKYLSNLILILLCAFLCVSSVNNLAFAQTGILNSHTEISGTRPPTAGPTLATPPAPNLNVKGYTLMDADTGQILAEKNMDSKLQPASLTKLMTLYIIEQALKHGQIHMNDPVLISENAWRTGGSRMFVKVGTTVLVHDLIGGIVVASGNDATVAMAEYLGGTEQAFTDIMNQEAAKLGMKNSHFTDANGLPSSDHYSSPRDLAILARAIIKEFPEYYSWYQTKFFVFNNIKQPSRNKLLWMDPTVDGLKTGFTDSAGYCLVASAKRKTTRLISVVMGAPSVTARTAGTVSLLNYGFRFFETYKLYPAASPVTDVRVWGGSNKKSALGLTKDLYITIPKGRYKSLQAEIQLNNMIKAPLVQGDAYGNMTLLLDNKIIATRPLVALQDNPKGNLWIRMRDSLNIMFSRFFHKNVST